MSEEIELAWAAGFFDGEGHFGAHQTKNGMRAGITIAQCHPEVLHRFKNAVGVGDIRGPFDNGSKHNQFWRYTCSAIENTRIVCEKLRPYLSTVKLAQMDNMLEKTSHMKGRTSSQDIEIIRKLFASGRSVAEIANIFDKSYVGTWQICHPKNKQEKII